MNAYFLEIEKKNSIKKQAIRKANQYSTTSVIRYDFASEASSVKPWKSMEIHGNLWECMEIFGNRWRSLRAEAKPQELGLNGDLWKSIECVEIYENEWKSMEIIEIYTNLRNSIEIY